MSYRNNNRFQRTESHRLNQYQPSTARFVSGPQAYNQQQSVGNIRFSNANLSSVSTPRVQQGLNQPQNVYSPLQTVQASSGVGAPAWGVGLSVQAGQQQLQPSQIPPGFQNPGIPNMGNPQQNAGMMGLITNQQLLAQAAGLVATPGMGMQVPFTGPGILGAAPMRGQIPPVYSNVGQTGLGSNDRYSPSTSSSQRNSRSANQHQGQSGYDKRSFDRSRSDSRDRRGQNRDHSNDGRRDDRRDDRKDERKMDKNNDRRDFKKTDQRENRRDNRNVDARKTDRRDDRKNVQRNDRNDDRKDNRRDDKQFVRNEDRRDVKRDDKSGDKRKPADRKGNSDSDTARRGNRGDNPDQRDKSRDRKSNQGNRPYRDGDHSDNNSSPEKKKFKGKDNSKSAASRKSRSDDQESETDGNDNYEDMIEEDIPAWLRCSPSDLYFSRDNTMIKDTTLVYACLGGRDLHVGLDCDEFHLVPGAIISQLTVEALNRASQIQGHKTIYFIAGIPDLLTTLTSPGYEETIFEDRNLFDTFYGQMRQTDMALKLHNCHVIFSTISSMSLREYNENNKKLLKTYTLRFEKNYPEMQEGLHRLLKQINNTITSINTRQKLLTPFIHSYVNKRSSGKSKIVYRLNKLLDGLNPCGTIIDGWRNTLNKTILRNKVMMSKPDFFK